MKTAFIIALMFSISYGAAARSRGQNGSVVFSMLDGFITSTPTVKIEGKWLTPQSCWPIDDDAQATRFRCIIAHRGALELEQIRAGEWQLSMTATSHLVLEGLGFKGHIRHSFSESKDVFMLSNGFQSWSNSGWVMLPLWPDPKAMRKALVNNDETRDGTTISWEFSALSNRSRHLWWGATAAGVFKPWIQFGRLADHEIGFLAIAGDTGESVTIEAGETFQGDAWYIATGNDLTSIQRDYAGRLPYLDHNIPDHEPRVGWNSWYNQWSAITEATLLDHLSASHAFFAHKFHAQGMESPPVTLFLDDGWEKMWGEWEAGSKFPSGLAAVANAFKQAGSRAGIWIAPFLVDNRSDLVARQPEWFVRNVIYHHPSGSYRVLDVTHPAAAAHLANVMQQLVAYGFDAIKIDFLMTGSIEGARHEPISGLAAFHRGMQIIREAAGENTYLLACGAPALASLPYVNAWRIGPDIAMGFPAMLIGPSWVDVAAQARNIGARWFLCNAVHCDADPVLQRFPHTRSSALTASWVAALPGGGLYISDDLRKLSQERQSWAWPAQLLRTALSGQTAVPEQQIPDQVPERMPSATTLKRVFFANDIVPPSLWRIQDNRLLFLNFSSQGRFQKKFFVPAFSSHLFDPEE